MVVMASMAAGLGGGHRGRHRSAWCCETVGAVVGLVIWAALTYVLGARLMPERNTRTDWASC